MSESDSSPALDPARKLAPRLVTLRERWLAAWPKALEQWSRFNGPCACAVQGSSRPWAEKGLRRDGRQSVFRSVDQQSITTPAGPQHARCVSETYSGNQRPSLADLLENIPNSASDPFSESIATEGFRSTSGRINDVGYWTTS